MSPVATWVRRSAGTTLTMCWYGGGECQGIFSWSRRGKQWWQLRFLFTLLLAFFMCSWFPAGPTLQPACGKQCFGFFCCTEGGFIASRATVKRGWEASSLEWGREDVVQCQLVPEPAGHDTLHFLRHTLDFYHPAGRTISPEQSGRCEWQSSVSFSGNLPPLSSHFLELHSFFDGDFLFDSHCSNQRMTQNRHPCSICVSFIGCVWLFRAGQALRNARRINTQKTKQQWKEKKRELKSISHYGHYSWLPSVIVTNFPKISLGTRSNLTAAQNVALRLNQ